MEFTDEQIECMHKKCLELLKLFIDVCEKKGYRYWALGGTLLGTIRHKGYIPWDDDIDVCMPREDYDAFAREAQELLPDWCFVQTVDTDKEYLSNIMKLRNSNTTYKEKAYSHTDINYGIYIDIFPLDNYYKGGFKKKIFDIKRRIFDSYIISLYFGRRETKKSRLAKWILRCAYRTSEDVIRGREKLYSSVKYTGMLCNYSGAWKEKEVFPAEWFDQTVSMQFEDIQINVPAEYDKILAKMYGDYMQLPPIEKRKAHHDIVVFDPERSYTEYRK